MARKASSEGVLYRHSRECLKRGADCGNTCNSDSEAPWEGWLFDRRYVAPATGRRGKKVRQRFATKAAAKGWRADALGQVKRRQLKAVDRATASRTLSEEIAEW